MSSFVKSLVLLASSLVLALGADAAQACDQPTYKKVVSYKIVEETVTKEVPYQKQVIKYDHCGKPYCTYVTDHKAVTQVICKKVPVVSYVKVCK